MQPMPSIMTRRVRDAPPLSWACAVGLAVCVCLPPSAGAAPHDHGTAQVQIALQGEQLTLLLQLPQDSLVGFEHAPRTSAQRQAMADALGRLRNAADLIQPESAAQCRLTRAEVKDPHAIRADGAGGGADHADVEAEIGFRCARAEQLRTLGIGLLETFPRLKRVQAVVATPQGQRKFTLRRPARELKLPR
jgi:hypothetical protein